MKKLFIFFLASVFCFGLFAEPKVPKYFSGDSEHKEKEYVYISNDLLNCYEIQALTVNEPKYKYKLNLKKRSLILDITMYLSIFFETEKQLDEFSNNIHLSDIENEFEKIRKLIILADEKSNIELNPDNELYNYSNHPKYIIYKAYGKDLNIKGN